MTKYICMNRTVSVGDQLGPQDVKHENKTDTKMYPVNITLSAVEVGN